MAIAIPADVTLALFQVKQELALILHLKKWGFASSWHTLPELARRRMILEVMAFQPKRPTPDEVLAAAIHAHYELNDMLFATDPILKRIRHRGRRLVVKVRDGSSI